MIYEYSRNAKQITIGNRDLSAKELSFSAMTVKNVVNGKVIKNVEVRIIYADVFQCCCRCQSDFDQSIVFDLMDVCQKFFEITFEVGKQGTHQVCKIGRIVESNIPLRSYDLRFFLFLVEIMCFWADYRKKHERVKNNSYDVLRFHPSCPT